MLHVKLFPLPHKACGTWDGAINGPVNNPQDIRMSEMLRPRMIRWYGDERIAKLELPDARLPHFEEGCSLLLSCIRPLLFLCFFARTTMMAAIEEAANDIHADVIWHDTRTR